MNTRRIAGKHSTTRTSKVPKYSPELQTINFEEVRIKLKCTLMNQYCPKFGK